MANDVSLIQLNPFPPTAVASRGVVEAVSLVTEPLREARQIAEQFVINPSTAEGMALAIIGDFGSGKTHLALDVLLTVQRKASDVKAIHVDAPGDSFMALYRERFLNQFTSAEFRKRIARFYSIVIADEIGDDELLAGLRKTLRGQAENPEDILTRYGLPAADFRGCLAERLALITPNTAFAVALSLLVRDDYEALVWDWLHGHDPDPALRERGVDAVLSSDEDALAAIGVFALAYSYSGGKFALVLDELEKVLSDGLSTVELRESSTALKRLMEVFARTGSLLILCGLPDYYNILPEDVQQRITRVIRPSPLSAADVRSYVEAVFANSVGIEGVGPFSDGAIKAIAQIAEGNVRRVVRLCRASYEVVADSGKPVSAASVRAEARRLFDTGSLADVRSEVGALLDQNGFAFSLNKRLSTGRGNVADIWVDAGGSDANEHGVALLFSPAVLEASEATALTVRGSNLKKSLGERGVAFLLVSGIVQVDLRRRIETAFDRVVATSDIDYLSSVEGALKSCLTMLGKKAGIPTAEVIASSLEQIVRQNTGMRRRLDFIYEETSNDARYRDAAAAGLRSVFAGLVGIGGNTGPGSARWVSGRSRVVLDTYLSLNERLWLEFSVLFDSSSDELRHRSAAPPPSWILEATTGLGCVAGMRSVMEKADRDLWEIFSAADKAAMDPVSVKLRTKPDDSGSIRELCMRIDYFAEILYSRLETSRREPSRQSIRFDFRDLGRELFEAATEDLERRRIR